MLTMQPELNFRYEHHPEAVDSLLGDWPNQPTDYLLTCAHFGAATGDETYGTASIHDRCTVALKKMRSRDESDKQTATPARNKMSVCTLQAN